MQIWFSYTNSRVFKKELEIETGYPAGHGVESIMICPKTRRLVYNRLIVTMVFVQILNGCLNWYQNMWYYPDQVIYTHTCPFIDTQHALIYSIPSSSGPQVNPWCHVLLVTYKLCLGSKMWRAMQPSKGVERELPHMSIHIIHLSLKLDFMFTVDSFWMTLTTLIIPISVCCYLFGVA